MEMKRYPIRFCVVIMLVGALNASAQKTRPAPARHQPGAPRTDTRGLEIFKSMLPATAKVMFIDSVVVSKDAFLSKIPLGKDIGQITVKKDGDAKQALVQFQNDFGGRRVYADGDSAGTSLYSQLLLGDGWSESSKIAGVDGGAFTFPNYPFLCADGTTMFFSARGPNSIGKRDIFVTTYDSDRGRWNEPQNYGLPYNSTANDYMLVVDDVNSLGWLVTDRFQAEGKVCVYTFVPTCPRLDFSADNLTNNQLEQFAKITDISRTWPFGDRDGALKRRDGMLEKNQSLSKPEDEAPFVLDNKRTVASPTELKSAAARKSFMQWRELKSMIKKTRSDLDLARLAYSRANDADARPLARKIGQLEKDLLQQCRDIHLMAKKIRQEELQP